MPCILCNSDLQTDSCEIESDTAKKKNLNKQKFILHSFCRHFQLNLPLPSVNWDLTKEDLPFCLECQQIAEKLVRLNRRLEILTQELERTEGLVRLKITKISKTCDHASKRWASFDGRIQTVRDIIMCPQIELTRVSCVPDHVTSVVIKVEPEILEDDRYSEFDISDDNFLLENSCNFDYTKQPSPKNYDKKPTEGTRKRIGKKKSKGSKLYVENSQKSRKLTQNLHPEPSACYTDANEFLSTDLPLTESRNQRRSDADSESGSFRRYTRRSTTNKTRSASEFDEPTEETTNDYACEDGSDLGESFSEELEDDPRDADYILPDDTAETLAVDNKLESRIKASLREKCPLNDKIAVRKSYYVPKKVTRLEGDKHVYKGHEFRGNNKSGFKCSQCSSAHIFRKRKQILLHIREVHMAVPGSCTCPTCGKSFSSVTRLRSHKRIHDVSDAVTCICELCGKDFKGEQPLKHHISFVHEKECTEMCDICGKKFKTKTVLKGHVSSVHFQEKICFCEICGKGFRSKSALKSHLQSSHDTETRFACDYCGQRFRRKPHWKRHLQQFHTQAPKIKATREAQPAEEAISGDIEEETVADDNLRCRYCGIQYNRQNNLTRHLLQIHHINVKGLSWKQGAPRNVLEKVTFHPDAVVKNALIPVSQSSTLVIPDDNRYEEID